MNMSPAASGASRQDSEETLYNLTPGSQYQILQPFTDYYGNVFERGELLHFRERHFLPYHGGHTVVFEERSLYLQEDINGEIIDHFSAYLARIPS